MENDPALTPRVERIAEGVFVRLAVDNMAWIDLGDSAVVVDALEQPELEGEVFAAIESTWRGQDARDTDSTTFGGVRYVLNTHGHYDHVALNDAFRRRWGAEVIGQPAAGLPPQGRWFEGPRRKLLMLPLPGCHTQEDCVVWLPEDKVLFVGDIFGWGLVPATRLDDKVARLLVAAYERLIAFGPKVVVPGHGPLCGEKELRRWVEYFRWLVAQVVRARAEGLDDARTRQAAAPPDDMKHWWRFLDWKHEDSLTRTMAAVRSGRLKCVPDRQRG